MRVLLIMGLVPHVLSTSAVDACTIQDAMCAHTKDRSLMQLNSKRSSQTDLNSENTPTTLPPPLNPACVGGWVKRSLSCSHAAQGNGGRYYGYGTEAQCQEKCDENTACKGFSYQKEEEKCFFFVTKACEAGNSEHPTLPCTDVWCNYDKCSNGAGLIQSQTDLNSENTPTTLPPNYNPACIGGWVK